jgi:hypothetical protein
MNHVLDLVSSVVIGGLVTLGVSYLYYMKAAQDLKAEAEKIRKDTNYILMALEDAKLAELTRDATGQITGLSLHLRGSGGGQSSGYGTLTVE